jgi:hypothetical protein
MSHPFFIVADAAVIAAETATYAPLNFSQWAVIFSEKLADASDSPCSPAFADAMPSFVLSFAPIEKLTSSLTLAIVVSLPRHFITLNTECAEKQPLRIF